MEVFDKLISVLETLNGPEGCPWDRKQTFHSLQKHLLEEAHEVVDAVDQGDIKHIIEELGDLFHVVLFYCFVAKREGKFGPHEMIESGVEKLIRRHPHVFGEEKVSSADEAIEMWKKVKQKEKGNKKKGPFDSIPKQMGPLLRGQKIIKAVEGKTGGALGEKEVGEKMLNLLREGVKSGVDVERAFRLSLKEYEEKALKEMDDFSPIA